MDDLIEKITKNNNVSNNEALIVVGIMCMVAYDNYTVDSACNVINDKLKTIAKNTLAMA